MYLKLAESEKEIIFLFDTRRNPIVDSMLSGDPPHTFEDHRKYIESNQEKKRWIYIAYEMDEMVGYSQVYGVTDSEMEVGFVIHPDYQNRGFGKELVKVTIKKAQETFPKRKTVLYVKKSNPKAIHVYEKLGFEEKGMRDDTVFMELRSS